MNKKAFVGIMLTVLLVGVWALVFNTQLLKATIPIKIYIKPDGSVVGTNKIKWFGTVGGQDYYRFTANISNSEVIVQNDNSLIDGTTNTLEGDCGIDYGIWVQADFVVIKNMTIRYFAEANIYLDKTSDCGILACNIENRPKTFLAHGIKLLNSSSNTISGNTLTKNYNSGINLYSSSNNSIYENTIRDSHKEAIVLSNSSNYNDIHHNTITDNIDAIDLFESSNYNNICNNTITLNSDAIDLVGSSNYNNICNNTITYNNENAIDLSESSNYNNICNNTITDNDDDAVDLSRSSNNTISGNTIINNDYGIYLDDCSNNTISGNTIINNLIGVNLFKSSNNSFYKNKIIANGNIGIKLFGSSNYNNICNNTITDNDDDAVDLSRSSNNTISGNTIINNLIGVDLSKSSNNSVYDNCIEDNRNGIRLSISSNHSICRNIIAYNNLSIRLDNASQNSIYHNDFVNNIAILEATLSINTWDNGTSGNYWSDYDGFDENGDRIGDTAHIIEHNNQDNYPQIVPLKSIPFFCKGVIYDCIFLGNATVSMPCFDYDSKSIGFNVSIATRTGYFNVTFPSQLLCGRFKVLVANNPVSYVLDWTDTHTSIIIEAPTRPFSEYMVYYVDVVAEYSIPSVPLAGDVNNDCIVDIYDVVLVADHFGDTCTG